MDNLTLRASNGWSRTDIDDIQIASKLQWYLEHTAEFLCRDLAEVKAKAAELGLSLLHLPLRRAA